MSTMRNFSLSIGCPDHVIRDPALAASDPRMFLTDVRNFIDACLGGMHPGAVGETSIMASMGSTAAAPAAASGTITFSGASGTVGATVNGTAKTFAHTSDSGDATALAAAINADSSLNKLVYATAATNVCTITAINRGNLGNAVTLVASGTGVSASAARLAGGVGGDTPQATSLFSITF